jgi:metallophosphoesterase (TIGR00282 family)
VTREVVEELFSYEIDVMTSGNHIWDKKEITEFMDDYESLLRPVNYPPGTPGRGSVIMPTPSGIHVGIINLMGRVFMRPIDCPFRSIDREIEKIRQKAKVILVDVHAEATSEKQALGWFLDGRVSGVVGTHTHVQTADNKVLPKGTAYITDAGMTGPHDSVIGTKKEAILERFLLQMPNKFDIAKGDVRFQAVALDIDETTGKAQGINRLDIPL